jgi:hypothetical protein
MEIGDKVRLVKFPQAKGIVSNITKLMIWCWIDESTKVAFAEPESVELDN